MIHHHDWVDKSAGEGSDTEKAKAAGEPSDDAFWPVFDAYFEGRCERVTGLPPSTPSPSSPFLIGKRAVTRDLTMDYGDFVLQGANWPSSTCTSRSRVSNNRPDFWRGMLMPLGEQLLFASPSNCPAGRI